LETGATRPIGIGSTLKDRFHVEGVFEVIRILTRYAYRENSPLRRRPNWSDCVMAIDGYHHHRMNLGPARGFQSTIPVLESEE
jgi:hypothetical protein